MPEFSCKPYSPPDPNPAPVDVLVVVEGGVVQNVLSDRPAEVRVRVKDYDCDGADPECLSQDKNGDNFIDSVYDDCELLRDGDRDPDSISLSYPVGSELHYKIPELDGLSVNVHRVKGGLAGAVTFPREVDEDEPLSPYDAGLDTLSSFLLAMVCEGYDLRDQRIRTAIRTTLDAMADNLE